MHFMIPALAALLSAQEPGNRPETVARGKLQGTWKLVKAEHDGREVRGVDAKLIIRGQTLTVVENKKPGESDEIVLRSDKSPKYFDVKVRSGVNAGKTCLGIYEIQGNCLKLCQTQAGRDRPTVFSSENQNNILFLEKEE